MTNQEIIDKKLEIFDRKIEEYYFSNLPSIFKGRKDLPFQRFNVINIYKKFSTKLNVISKDQLAYKLIDIKLIFSYLKTTKELFYLGPTLIVGNDELEKLNPNTISLLRENHYRVYLISILIEQILDLLQIIYFDELEDFRKNKWNNLVKKISPKFNFTSSEKQMIVDFKSFYRTAEFHKNSKVRGFLSKNKWDHFQKEEEIIEKLLYRI